MAIAQLGELALWIALPLGIWGAVVCFAGSRWGRPELVVSAGRSLRVLFALVLVAAAGLVAALVGDLFGYRYVYLNSSAGLDPAYKPAALWADPTGAILVWILAIAGGGAWAFRRAVRNPSGLAPRALGVLLTLLTALLGLVLLRAPPFQGVAPIPMDGRGMVPWLQSPWMWVHPPVLHLGLALLALPFAYGCGALLVPRPGRAWVRAAHPWALAGWALIGLGLLAGVRWRTVHPVGTDAGSWDPALWGAGAAWALAGGFLLLIRRAGCAAEDADADGGRATALRGVAACAPLLVALPATFAPAAARAGGGAAGTSPAGPDLGWGLLGLAAFGGAMVLVLAVRAASGEGWEAGGGARIGQGRARTRPGPGGGHPRRPDLLRRGGAAVALLGGAAVLAGVGGGLMASDVEEALVPGDVLRVASPLGSRYEATYRGLSTGQEWNAWEVTALFTVRGTLPGPARSALPTGIRFVHAPPGAVVREGSWTGLLDELRVRPVGLEEELTPGRQPGDRAVLFRMRVIPFGSWAWLGAIALVGGGVAALWAPGDGRVPADSRGPRERGT